MAVVSEQDQKYIDVLIAGMQDDVAEEEAAAVVIKMMRDIAREEVASLCGLVMRRLEDYDPLRDAPSPVDTLQSIFGEALRDFSGNTNEPGDAA